jgi:hypothetical protein
LSRAESRRLWELSVSRRLVDRLKDADGMAMPPPRAAAEEELRSGLKGSEEVASVLLSAVSSASML